MIDDLANYCETWGLQVNLDKSKILVFRESPRISSSLSWSYNAEPIDIVNEYKYLGVLMTYNMSFRKHLSNKLVTAKNAINSTWASAVSDPKINVCNKLKIYNAAARSILLYASQVWGFLEFEEVERLLRYFLKRILMLPKNTPNYMLFLETRIKPLYISTLQTHFEYVKKATNMPETRLPHILAKETFKQQSFWVSKWINLYSNAHISLPTDLCFPNLARQHSEIIDGLKTSYELKCIESARNSQNHDLYSQLNYDVEPYCFEQQSIHCISLFFKARGGLLNINGNPFIRTFSDRCPVCNLNEIENTYHLIGVCPIYRGMRKQYLRKPHLTIPEVISLLNSSEPRPLYEFLSQSLKYRHLLLNEFN